MSKIVGSNLDNEYPLASHRPARTVKRELTQTKQVKTKVEEVYGNAAENAGRAHLLMENLGILDQIPAETSTTEGYKLLSSVKRGLQKKTRKKGEKNEKPLFKKRSNKK